MACAPRAADALCAHPRRIRVVEPCERSSRFTGVPRRTARLAAERLNLSHRTRTSYALPRGETHAESEASNPATKGGKGLFMNSQTRALYANERNQATRKRCWGFGFGVLGFQSLRSHPSPSGETHVESNRGEYLRQKILCSSIYSTSL